MLQIFPKRYSIKNNVFEKLQTFFASDIHLKTMFKNVTNVFAIFSNKKHWLGTLQISPKRYSIKNNA